MWSERPRDAYDRDDTTTPRKVRTAIRPLLALLIVGSSAGLFGLASLADAQSESTIDLVAIDADITGNGATTLGPLDGCLSIDLDETATVDLVIDAIPDDKPMIGFQMVVSYDPAVLQVIDVDSAFLLAAEDAYQPIEGLSDALPDGDGEFLIAIADIASNVEDGTSIESGEGVISRVTFRPLTSGITTVAVGFDPPNVYPSIIDPTNSPVQVDNIGSSEIAIGEPCPANAEPEIRSIPPLVDLIETPVPTAEPPILVETETATELNVTLIVVAAVVGAVGAATLAAGGFLISRRSTP